MNRISKAFQLALWIVPLALIAFASAKRLSKQGIDDESAWLDRINHAETVKAQYSSNVLTAAHISLLRHHLKSPVASKRLKAAWVLGVMGDFAKSAESDLAVATKDAIGSVQVAAMEALIGIGTTNQDLIPQIVLKLHSNHPSIAYSAALLIDVIERERELHHFTTNVVDQHQLAMEYIQSSIPSVRVRGAYRLARLSVNDTVARESLESMLNDPDPWVRERASVFLRYPTSIPYEGLNTAYHPRTQEDN